MFVLSYCKTIVKSASEAFLMVRQLESCLLDFGECGFMVLGFPFNLSTSLTGSVAIWPMRALFRCRRLLDYECAVAIPGHQHSLAATVSIMTDRGFPK